MSRVGRRMRDRLRLRTRSQTTGSGRLLTVEDLTAMRNLDLSPLFRHSVGYDRLDQLFESAFRDAQETSYPPYNIVKAGRIATASRSRSRALPRATLRS